MLNRVEQIKAVLKEANYCECYTDIFPNVVNPHFVVGIPIKEFELNS